MSENQKTAGVAATPLEQHGRDLQRVNDKLKDLVESLRSSRERAGDARGGARAAAAPAPAPSASPEGEAVDLDRRRLEAEAEAARAAAASAREERERLAARLAEIEAEHRRICDEYVAFQQQSTELAHRCAALEAIHGGPSRADTLAALQEIVINCVGSEELVIFERRGDALVPVRCFGIDLSAQRAVPLGEGVIGGAAATGRVHVPRREDPVAPGEADLTAAIPLRAGERVVGAIAIYRLLRQKPRLEDADRALLELVSAHGGLALHLRAAEGPAAA